MLIFTLYCSEKKREREIYYIYIYRATLTRHLHIMILKKIYYLCVNQIK